MEIGPLGLTGLKCRTFREADPNSFCLTPQGLIWKFDYGNGHPGCIPFEGEGVYEDRAIGSSLAGKAVIVLPCNTETMRLTLDGLQSGYLPVENWPLGSIMLPAGGSPCLAIASGQDPEIVELATGMVYRHIDNSSKLAWFTRWTLSMATESGQLIQLARSQEPADQKK